MRTLIARTMLAVALLCSLAAIAAAQTTRPRQVENTVRERALVPYRQGFEHLNAEAFSDATRAFQQAVDIDPNFELAFYMLGRSFMAERRYVEAISALNRCRDLYMADAGRQFTTQQDRQRYRQDRLMEVDDLIRQYQNRPQSASTAETLRQLNERRRQLEENLTRGENNTAIENTIPAFVSLSLGSAYFRTEKFADAEREYKASIASDPKGGEARNNLAVVYLLTNRPELAEKEVKAAEKAGFRVAGQLKDDIKAALRAKKGTD